MAVGIATFPNTWQPFIYQKTPDFIVIVWFLLFRLPLCIAYCVPNIPTGFIQ
jgi:hypothetical protein